MERNGRCRSTAVVHLVAVTVVAPYAAERVGHRPTEGDEASVTANWRARVGGFRASLPATPTA